MKPEPAANARMQRASTPQGSATASAAEDTLSGIFLALADPTRRAILTLLRDDDATVGQLAHHFPISQPAISRHLRMLETAGLIRRRPVGTATINSLRAEPLVDAVRYLQRFEEYWQVDDEPMLDSFTPDLGTAGYTADDWII